jgi:hypothetical protein
MGTSAAGIGLLMIGVEVKQLLSQLVASDFEYGFILLFIESKNQIRCEVDYDRITH